MTVKELIDELSLLRPDYEVLTYQDSPDRHFPVTSVSVRRGEEIQPHRYPENAPKTLVVIV